MAFESFLNKPYDEFQLLLQIAEEVKNDYQQHRDMNHYLHLIKAGDKTSMINKIKLFGPGDNPWIHVYVDNDKNAGILFGYKESCIIILLNGEHVYAEVSVTADAVTIIDGPGSPLVPEHRESNMTMLDIMAAFGDINSALEEYHRYKAG
jgi:hypothetical protein